MLFSDAIDRASTPVPITNGSWLTPGSTLKLHPDRWHFHKDEPAGAVGQVQWCWVAGPPPPSDHPNHPSARAVAQQLGQQLDECEALGMIEGLP